MITLEEARKRVIDWNTIARLPEMITQDIMDNQIRVCTEEAIEFEQAKANHDLIEILDGACDVLVTFSYLSYLQNHDTYPNQTDLVYFSAIIEAENLLGVKNTRLGLTAVLNSNDTKFQPFKDTAYHDAQCRWIEENRPHTDTVKWHKQNNIVHYRDKNGIGKIMKPSTFIAVDLSQFIK